MNFSLTYRNHEVNTCPSLAWTFILLCASTIALANKPDGTMYIEKGDGHFQNNRFEEAQEDYLQAAAWYEKTRNSDSLAILEVRIAKTWLMMGEYQKGKTLMEKLTTNHELAHATASEAWFVLAECYFYLSKPQAALKAYLTSRALYQQNPDVSPVRAAHFEMSMGNVYRYELYDFQSALKHYFKALEFLGNNDDEQQKEIIFWCYYNIAGTYRSRLQPEQAANYGDLLIKMALESQNVQQLEYAYTLSANIAVVRKNYTQASHLYQKIIQAIESGQINNAHLYLTGVENLASVYLRNQQTDSALHWVKKAKAYLNTEGSSHYVTRSNLHEIMAGIYEAKGNINLAEKEALLGLQMAKQHLGSDHPQIAKMQNMLARLAIEKHEYSRALACSQMALATVTGTVSANNIHENPLLSSLKTDNLNFSILLNKGLAIKEMALKEENIDLLNTSQQTFLLADSVAERTLQSSLLENDKVLFARESMQLYEPALQLAMQLYQMQNHKDQLQIILHWMEKNKSRVLQKAIYEARQVNSTGIPDSLIIRQYDISRQLQQLTHGSPVNDSLEDTRLRLLQKLQQIQQNIDNQYSNYALFSQGLPSLQIERLQQYVSDQQKAIIHFFTGNKHIYILGIWPTGIKAHQVPVNDDFLTNLNDFFQSLHVMPKTGHAGFKMFTKSAFYLYGQLLHPVMEDVERMQASVSGIQVIADGILAGIPFECLLTEKYESENIDYKSLNYLIRYYDVSYALAAGLLLPVSANQEYARIQRAGVFAYTQLDGFAPLPNSLKEAEMIKKNMSSKSFLEKEATLAVFREKAKEFDLLHLAIHGQWHREMPFLMFQPDDNSDGLLQINDLYTMQLSAQLAILSACETGVGTVQDGEGIISIARGFFYAGCPAVIMSLGKIHDHTVVHLMERMYYYMLRGKNLDYAISQSKRDWLASADEYTAHPGFWTSMVLMGKPDVLQFTGDTSIMAIMAKTGLFLILILISAYWIYRKKSEKNRLFQKSATTATYN